MKTFILLSAIPGAGKSTWAKIYQKEHPNTYIVSSDDVRTRVAGRVNCFDKEPLVWKTFLDEINNCLSRADNVTVIGDSTNLQNKYRQFYHDATPAFDKHVLVIFKIPLEICQKQNKMRVDDRVVPPNAMKKLEAEWQDPTTEIISLYDELIVIDKSFVSAEIAKQFE